MSAKTPLAVPAAEHAEGALRLCVMAPPPDLAPYLSAYYRTEIADGEVVEDWLPPEEANLRTGRSQVYQAAIGGDSLAQVPPAVISGPTDRVTRLRIGGGKFWGIGLTPAGWARFIRFPASEMANKFCAIENSAAHPSLTAMLEGLRAEGDDLGSGWKGITQTFRALLGAPLEAESTIRQAHLRFLAPETATVGEISSALKMNARTFERFSNRHFGFTPRTLLRRQRFLRSLSQYMLDPTMRWIRLLDSHYFDQAHFIRDFRATMGMTPRAFAALPHPIAAAAANVTHANAGVAMQALYCPEGGTARQSGL